MVKRGASAPFLFGGAMLYREWCRKVNQRRGVMVTLEGLANICKTYDPGYASVYMFDEDAAAEIREAGHSRGLDAYTVYADALVIDLDGGDTQLAATEPKLVGHQYDVWASGRKGYHIVLPHELVGSEHLPYSHRRKVQELGVDCDTSLYQHGRVISLPGRIHPKTRRPKTFLKSVEGGRLTVPIVEPPEPKFNFLPNGGLDTLQSGLFKLSEMSICPPAPGNRHTRIWAASDDLANAGLNFETVLALMQEVNRSWPEPKQADEVELAVSQAFKRNSPQTS